MTRHLFGGTSADSAEDLSGARVPGAEGTLWDGPGDGATQLLDMTDLDGGPLEAITANDAGMIPAFYGPEGDPEVVEVWADFGGGRVVLQATDTARLLAEHVTALDPHGDQSTVMAAIDSRTGQAGGLAPLDYEGRVPLSMLPAVRGPETAISVADLLSDPTFYIAHRGSGMEYPEHTMAAYNAALTSGVRAIEVSANITADGVLVAMHDPKLDRTTNASGDVSSWVYASLAAAVRVQPAAILGQGWEPQPIPTIREVLDRFLGKVVIFLEGKTNEATTALQRMLDTYYPTASESVVWKGYYKSPTFARMRAKGFSTWAYLDDGTTDSELTAVDANVDFWGVPHTMPETRMTEIVKRGKPVICWEVHRRAQRDRLVGLGVRGMMCAQYQWVTATRQILQHDAWATLVKAPGDMGRTYYSGTRALKYGNGAAYMDVTGDAVLVGSCSLPAFPANGYRITWSQAFDSVPPTNEHSGIAFGKPDDTGYQFGAKNESGGYHVCFRGNGDLQLYSHAAGEANGTPLVSAASAAPKAGTFATFQADVMPTKVTLTRTDVSPNVTITSTNTAYRGGYIHISGGSVSNIANRPRFKNLTVAPL